MTVECSAAAWGGPQGRGWLSPASGALVGGPIAWPGLRNYVSELPASGYRTRRGLARGFKALVAVMYGRVVRVAIPTSERSRLSMDYNSTPLQPRAILDGYAYFRIADGATNATFHACAGPGVYAHTPFPGLFIVAGKQCARIDIYTSASHRPLVRQIPFGVPRRSCPATG